MIYVINESNNNENEIIIDKTNSDYYLYLNKKDYIYGNWVSHFSYANHIHKNFDWFSIFGVFTEDKYRGHGYVKILIDEFYKDIKKKYNGKIGIYLFVHTDNISAIKLYTKCGFIKITNYTSQDTKEDFFIMAKGNKSIFYQLYNKTFSDDDIY